MDPFSLDHIIPSPLPAYTGKSSSGPYGPLFASIILNFQKSALLSFSSFHSSRPEAPPLLREVFTPHGTRQHSGTLSHLYVFKELPLYSRPDGSQRGFGGMGIRTPDLRLAKPPL